MSERRAAERTEITIPVELEKQTGTTANISSSGVYFTLAEPLEMDASLTFTLVFDAAHQVPVRIACRGRVVRVDSGFDSFGVGVEFESFGADESPSAMYRQPAPRVERSH